MDTKQLQTFIAMAQEPNYHKVSERLQYSPSTLLKHIRQLENELGVELFRHEGRNLVLNTAGEGFIEPAERMLRAYDEALNLLSQKDCNNNRVSVAGCEINLVYALLPMFVGFNSACPQIDLSIHSLPNRDVPEQIKLGKSDIGYYYSPEKPRFAGMQTVPLYREEFILMASPDNPLCQREGLQYKDLTGNRFVYTHESCCTVPELVSRMKQADAAFSELSFVGSVNLVGTQTASSDTVTIAPRTAANLYTERFGIVPLKTEEAPIVTWNVLLLSSIRALSSATNTLLRYSIEHAKKPEA